MAEKSLPGPLLRANFHQCGPPLRLDQVRRPVCTASSPVGPSVLARHGSNSPVRACFALRISKKRLLSVSNRNCQELKFDVTLLKSTKLACLIAIANCFFETA